jgi:hypothetical protein
MPIGGLTMPRQYPGKRAFVLRPSHGPITATCPRCGKERRNIGNGTATYRCDEECEKALLVEAVNPVDESIRFDKPIQGAIRVGEMRVEAKYYRPVSLHRRILKETWEAR